MNFATRAAELSDTIIADRHYLHQHAELSFQEHEFGGCQKCKVYAGVTGNERG